ncbi:GlxA family transcriptional regulator [Rhizobium sp. L1K21]|uniref:GlxA family transcriptional regulator n=1 Tax=Rhizobium sp. L1K21 TaxID=2954933 RepID=UPI0020935086|nr:GlxA family transcriptional regulator [Rhizobium sp. L1K21]MCO6184699.1 GlxA family transcriptional regulator [Rhizobium sp. L1K21]
MFTPEIAQDPLEIDVLVFPDINLILLASIIEPLRGANRIAGRELCRWRLFSPDGAPVVTTSGLPFPVDGAFPPGRETAPLFVVSAYNWRRFSTPQMRMQLSRSARKRPNVIGVESGTWLMAEASLLDGYKATVHWEDFDEFAAAYPQIEVVRSRFIIDGKRITTGGALPALDLMLELIRRRFGYSLALEVSRLFIYEPAAARERGQALPLAASRRPVDKRVAAAIHAMEENIEIPLSLEAIASQAGVSARRLQALFKGNIGVLPHIHYLALRLNAARRRVIETQLPFTEIAVASGFNSASAFSRSYRAHFHESPSETRRRLIRENVASMRSPQTRDRIRLLT